MLAKQNSGTNPTLKIAGMPMGWFLVFAVILIVASFFSFGPEEGSMLLPANMLGALSLMVILGAIFNFIGDRTPVVNQYLGGGPVVIIFGTAALVYFKLMPEALSTTIKTFTGKTGFLDWYIAALITGSILGMNRKLLITAFARYIPAILGGVALALGLCSLVGAATGFGWKQAMMFVGIPIMGGGLGAGAVPLSKIYSSGSGLDAAQLLSMMIPAVALGNALSVISAGLLDRVGKVRQSLTGNGQLLVTDDPAMLKAEQRPALTLEMLGVGIVLAGAFYVVGQALSLLVPSIHAFAFMIISVAAVKAFGLLPADIESSAHYWFQFMSKNLTYALLVGVGVTYTDLGQILQALTPQYLAMVVATIIGAIVGAGFIGKCVGFYPIESSITAGLCMSNMGGTGDVATLGAAKRMELMPFAQISSRIGGAIMLIIGSLAISLLS